MMAQANNVVRFPLTKVLPQQVSEALDSVPDVREVMNVVEAFQMDMPPHNLRERIEAEVAAHVLSNVPPEPGARRDAALRDIMASFNAKASAAAEVSREAWEVSEAAQRQLAERQQWEGAEALEVLKQRADDLSNQAAHLFIESYRHGQEAFAAGRVVSMAERGEAWRPFNLREEERALFGDAVVDG